MDKQIKMGKKQKVDVSYYTLFVKFSRRIPNPLNIQDEVRAMCSNVSNVRKPRQKNARWILVDFESLEHAEGFKKLLEEKKHISTLPVKVKKMNIKLNDSTKGENSEHCDKINSLARQTFQSSKLDKYSNKLLVTNIPKTTTMEELRELFPGHLKIDLKQTPTTRAYITYSSAKEAFNMRMSLKPVIAREKFRVIILLLDHNKTKKGNKSDETGLRKQPTGRYFENDIE